MKIVIVMFVIYAIWIFFIDKATSKEGHKK